MCLNYDLDHFTMISDHFRPLPDHFSTTSRPLLAYVLFWDSRAVKTHSEHIQNVSRTSVDKFMNILWGPRALPPLTTELAAEISSYPTTSRPLFDHFSTTFA